MNYHNITKDDMLNGPGLRVVLWVAGCSHHCKGCQNPITWNPEGGADFTTEELEEIHVQLSKDYISGITFSGGDPLHENNRSIINMIIDYVRKVFPDKSIWLYTGYTWEQIVEDNELFNICSKVDVVVDGKFEEELADVNYHWAGSTNQRVIDVELSLKVGVAVEIVSDGNC